MTATRKQSLHCPCCGSYNIAYLEDETYCRECGLVIQGVPIGTQKYVYGYIIGGKRLLYTTEK